MAQPQILNTFGIHSYGCLDMSIFGAIHLQHWYPNYQHLDVYSGCYIQCQCSDRSICNIGTQITQIWIYILDVISNVNIRIDPFTTLVPKLPRSRIYIYIYIHILDITSRIYIHILDITSKIHIQIWKPPGRLNGGVWGADAPQESKSDRCEQMSTLLDFGPQIPNLVIPISTISIYENRPISMFFKFWGGGEDGKGLIN